MCLLSWVNIFEIFFYEILFVFMPTCEIYLKLVNLTDLLLFNPIPILRLPELTYLELGNRITCYTNGPAMQKASGCQNKLISKVITVQIVSLATIIQINYLYSNYYWNKLILTTGGLLHGRAFCMTWNPVVLFHGG